MSGATSCSRPKAKPVSPIRPSILPRNACRSAYVAHKRRLRNHHGRDAQGDGAGLRAQQYILVGPENQPEPEGTDETVFDEAATADGDRPVVVAEMATEIPSLTVSEAVMRLDLADQAALMFRNSAHGGLNMIYRRSDGNIGWVDPEGNRNT